MERLIIAILAGCTSLAAAAAAAPPETQFSSDWIDTSNAYTNQLLALQFEHNPERGSHQGLAKFDERVSKPTLADELRERRELEAALGRMATAGAKETDRACGRIWRSCARPST